MTMHRFETRLPVRLVTEIAKGSVKLVATETTETIVEIFGHAADQVRVSQDGDQITVIGPKQHDGFFGGDTRLDVAITLPADSQVAVRTGSADITVVGSVGVAHLKSGSGDLVVDTATKPMVLDTGSGNIRVENARDDVKASSGSGDVSVTQSGAVVEVSTGSGDVQLGTTRGATSVKTGSGDIRVGDAGTDVTLRTGSGDLTVGTARRGRVTVEGASGDAHVGVPAGIAVWTDISTVTGQIRSSLHGAGQPKDGADYLEIRARIVTGDVVLTEV
ncbi:DUF4097 family beta strand repeat-containing protein [Devosia sp. LjRoot16]|uniref:DUF4097 family beta strand repeat-containing protein n=1 Tax=unclassified Devosia TaxID=196773 RepID=UPI0006FD46AA|nr:DUF4097 family beta strand repeat-containing protein [Devosia sp. Root105]KQU97574.1 hypothetical protein ASC68_12350 [Devosia sp. Root105]